MEFKQWLLNEMPLRKAERIGAGWSDTKNNHWWDKPSIKLLQSEKALNKINLAWQDTRHDYDVYFLKDKGMRDTLEKGEVNIDYVKENLGLQDFKNDEDAITIIFTNNRGADRMPMTAWVIAHRFAHAMIASERYNSKGGQYRRFSDQIMSDFKNLLGTIYNYRPPASYSVYDSASQKYLKELMQALGTMKSARDKQLFRPGEFSHELVAQFIINGQIKFNKQFPKAIDRKMAWGKEYYNKYSQVRDDSKKAEIEDTIETMEDTYNWMAEELLDQAVGKIYVM